MTADHETHPTGAPDRSSTPHGRPTGPDGRTAQAGVRCAEDDSPGPPGSPSAARGGSAPETDARPRGRGRALLGPMARYAELFQAQGAVRFVAAGFVARLTVAMAGLALVLALSEDNGSYALAGTVTGVLGLASAVVGPQVGRLHDRYGQDRVLPPLALVFGCSMGLIIAAIAADWPAWTLFPLAAAAGASLPLVGSLVRARWTKMYRGTEQLRTCYALEGATEEAVYIVGPVLVTALATGIGPLVGLGAVLGCAVLGTLSLAVQRSTQPEPSAHTGKAAPVGVMRLPAMRLLFAVMLGIGGVFGSMEIIVVGFATEQGSRGASGLLLGVWGVSSLLAGLVYGVAKVRTPLHRRFTWAVLGFAAGLLPLLLAGNLLTLSLLLLVAGPSMSLAMVIGMEVIEQVVPEASLTEGIAWSSGGTGFGMTIGSAAGGWAVDALGAGRAFGVPAACAVAGLLIVLAGRRTLAAGCARGA